MTASATFRAMTGALVLGLLACGQTERNEPTTLPMPSGSHSGGQATAGGSDPAQGGSTVANGGQAGASSSSAGTDGSAGTSMSKPTPIEVPITQVVKSAACGKPYAGGSDNGAQTTPTMGVKAADCAYPLGSPPVCGPWAATRRYNVYLPQDYDPEKPYSLIIEAAGCGDSGILAAVLSNNVDKSVIRVGLAPGPNSKGDASVQNPSCFDTREGDDSIDWVMYEALYDQLNSELCFDRNRVFVGGYSNGASLANELGCKYAGDSLRPVRAVLPNGGALPTDPREAPTCSTAPLAGLWIHQVESVNPPFEAAKVAIERAMTLNACPDGGYDTAPSELFPIGGGQPNDTCKRLSGCSPLYPIVVCPLLTGKQTSNQDVVKPAWSTFIELFQAPPLLTE